ncbi:hypothetical protein LguiA_013046 [Lonicera macranthoides]
MVVTRSRRKFLKSQPHSPKVKFADKTISADNLSLAKITKERTGWSYDTAQMKATFSRMKAKTNTFNKLINTTGFGWNSKTNTVTPENDWTTYLKVQNPFRT